MWRKNEKEKTPLAKDDFEKMVNLVAKKNREQLPDKEELSLRYNAYLNLYKMMDGAPLKIRKSSGQSILQLG